ncbi:MAG: dihydroorotate dehydrogenase B catalytic subunit [Candidatus Aquicultor primus]|uniref:Dihydroorotate dehydrogenase n=1 Tax=Candidatus Aquicultor primus TaxID=1797195 RepID=A0A1F2USN3_9ACTN|nr:MAG: dihydroorotate dehydrogenase B catalytic subunit [Candidatus Aquicultor primus]
MSVNLSVNLSGIKMKNPVMPASGTFGAGREYSELMDINRLGALVAKTVTLKPRDGNIPPRLCEVSSGMLNSIGLQNEGIDHFFKHDLPFMKEFDVPIIINIAGNSLEEYAQLCREIDRVEGVSGIELNISCPNIKAGGIAFGASSKLAEQVTAAARYNTQLPLIVKLTPNVYNISKIARAVTSAGADAISLINTMVGMSIDTNTFKPNLGNITGGLSGPAIKPIAVRMVWEVAQSVKIPIIGIGGISNALDAVEFFLAGATAVAVGTANFINPQTMTDIISGLEAYLVEKGFTDISQIIGKVKT